MKILKHWYCCYLHFLVRLCEKLQSHLSFFYNELAIQSCKIREINTIVLPFKC